MCGCFRLGPPGEDEDDVTNRASHRIVVTRRRTRAHGAHTTEDYDGVLYDVHARDGVACADARRARGEQGEDDDARGIQGCGARERGGRRRGYGH